MFMFVDDLAGTISNAVATALLFLGDEKMNIEFMKNYRGWLLYLVSACWFFTRWCAGITMKERPIKTVTIDPNLIQSGDFIGLIHLVSS